MRVLVSGSSGFIGRHLLANLRLGGNEAIGLARGAEAGPDTVAGPADLADIGDWAGWPANVDAVVHLAGAIPRKAKINEADLLRANVEATRSLTKRARAEGVKRVVFVSTASVHGPGSEQPYTESDSLNPPNDYARSKQLAEAAFWAALDSDLSSGIVIRPTPVFGNGSHGPVAVLAKLARLPLPLPLEGIGGLRSIVSVDSLVDILSACLTSDRAGGETLFAAEDEPLRADDIVSALRTGAGRSPSVFKVPGGLLKTAAKLAGSSQAWNSMTRPFVVNTGRLREVLGWRSPRPVREQLKQLAATGAM